MAKKKSIGLPGGPNEYITHVSEIFSTEGYKRNSPDVNNPYNIIPSSNITMEGVDFPVRGYGNNGVVYDMKPGVKNYNYGDADHVVEVPMAQNGIEVPKRKGVRNNPNGSVSTHLMATETLDGKNWFSFPTLFQDPDGTWIDMSNKPWQEAYEEAKKRNELIDFGTDKEAAIKFGEGSWKPKFQSRGEVNDIKGVVPNQESVDNSFQRQWLDSPMYKKILANEVGPNDDPQFITNSRISNLENVPIIINPNTHEDEGVGATSWDRNGELEFFKPSHTDHEGHVHENTFEHEVGHSGDRVGQDTLLRYKDDLSLADKLALANASASALPSSVFLPNYVRLANQAYNYVTGQETNDLEDRAIQIYKNLNTDRLIPEKTIKRFEEERLNIEGYDDDGYPIVNDYDEASYKNYDEDDNPIVAFDKDGSVRPGEIEISYRSQWADYVSDPTEARTRLNTIRAAAKDLGIYDPMTEPLTREKFQQIIEKSSELNRGEDSSYNPLLQLQDIYSNDEIFNQLNEVSSVDKSKDKSRYAQYGGSLPKAQNGKEKSFEITPELLLKQAFVESLLNPNAKNDLGYKGIAQIGDDLIKDYKKANKVESVDPFNAQQNHDVQEWSMNELYNSSFVDKPTSTAENRLLKSLASYNWGRGKVLKLLNEEKANGTDIYTGTDWTEKLPQQTKDYINMIVYDGSTEKRPQVQENFIKATTDDKYKEIRDIYKYQYGGDLLDERVNSAFVQDNTYVNNFMPKDPFPSLRNINKSIDDYKFDFSDYEVKDKKRSSDNNVENNHVVAKGESLGLIAKKYNTSVSEIASLNNIQDPNLININQKLKLPNIEVSDKKEYVIKAGDTLNEIAKKYGTTSNKLAEINGIENINVISINQRLQLPDNYIEEVSLAEESWISTDKLKQNRKDINGGDDESVVVKSQMLNDPNQRYVVIDKKSQRLKLYQGDNVIMDFEVGTGQNAGDAQTVTKNKYIDPNGNIVTPKEAFIAEEKDGKIVYEKLKPGYKSKVDWSAGNKQTGAGKFTMGSVGEYKDTPSFTLVNENGIEIPAVIHAALNSRKQYFDNDNIEDNRMSNGCINGQCSDLEALYNTGLPPGSPVFILPEEDGNYFEFADGQAVLRTSGENRVNADSYIDSQGRKQKGQGINRSTNTLNYKEIRPVFDEEKFMEDKFTYFDFNDTEEYEGSVKPFVNSLVDNKQRIMKVAGISSDEYNEIAQIAFGILGNETNFGDTHSEVGNAIRGARKKFLDPKSSSPDYRRKFDGYSFAEGADSNYNSVGLTQLRYQEVKDEGKKRDKNGNILASERDKVMPAEKMFNDLGITSNEDLMDPEKAAIATVARLAFLVNNRKGVDKNNLMNTLPGHWGGSSSDNKSTYINNVKKNSKYLKLQQLDRVLPTNEEGGEMNEFDMYQGYLNGKYDGTEQEREAEDIYDKLNRKHYREAKMYGMTPSNFIATHFLNKA